jgi:Outer membrane lipoprotein-sorting protein
MSTSDSALAQGNLTADQIADRAVRTDTFNWEAARTRVRMILIEADGAKKERSMDVLGRRKDGRYQSMVRFLSPADIAGTAFLMLESGKDESEQYIYLPGLKRTRRIVGREREGSFMGSDFTYADLQGIDNKQAKHVKLADENVGNEACYVVESTINPSAKVAYGKIVTWVRKSDFIALRTRFHDKSGKLVKTLYSRRVKAIEGKPVVVEARMQNENKHVTEMFVDSIEKQTDLADSNFTPSALEHL